MNQFEFDMHVTDTLNKARDLLCRKNAEYKTVVTEPLSNFKTEGASLGLTPAMIALVYMNKHISSVKRFVLELEKEEYALQPTEPIEGRLLDIINYCVFLSALLRERDAGKAINLVDPARIRGGYLKTPAESVTVDIKLPDGWLEEVQVPPVRSRGSKT